MQDKRLLQHVHVGTGALGLGLIAWSGSQAGLSLILANRAHGSPSLERNRILAKTHEYYLIFADEEEKEPERVNFTDLFFTDRDYDRFIATVSDPKTILLTTALKQGLEPSIPLLKDALVARVEAAISTPLYVVACENALDSLTLHKKIVSILPANIDLPLFNQTIAFVPCVVDRMCNEPWFNKATGRVEVEVESFAQWILKHDHSYSPFLEEYLRCQATQYYIDFVENIEPYIRRKRWLVNGPHLLIALNALADGYDRLDRYLQEYSPARELLERLLEEARLAFESIQRAESIFDSWESYSSNRITRERFTSYPDSVTRILSRFTQSMLHEFFQDLYRKVTQPILEYMHTHELAVPYWTAQTLFLVTQLIYESKYVED